MVDHDDVAIVGAGPVGLITAHELARRNLPVRLLDKRPGPSHTTRAFTLHARTMEMFEHIGVADEDRRQAAPAPGAALYVLRRLAVDRLTVAAVARELGRSWDTVNGIAVAPPGPCSRANWSCLCAQPRAIRPASSTPRPVRATGATSAAGRPASVPPATQY